MLDLSRGQCRVLRLSVLGIFLISGFLFSSLVFSEEPPPSYVYCLEEGVKAYNEKNDISAQIYFENAHFIFPDALEPAYYLSLLKLPLSARPNILIPLVQDDVEPQYEELLHWGQKAFEEQDYNLALEYFSKAQLSDPKKDAPLDYINLIKRFQEKRVQVVSKALDGYSLETVDLGAKPVKEVSALLKQDDLKDLETPKNLPRVVSQKKKAKQVEAQVSKIEKIEVKNTKGVDVITLDDIRASNQAKPSLSLEVGSSVIVEGVHIKRFLQVDPDVIVVKSINQDQIRIDAQRWSNTFLHIWDDSGRVTLFVEVTLPQTSESILKQQESRVERSAPFRMRYGVDNSSYYYGSAMDNLERRGHSIQQTVGLEGSTPYGYLDASLAVEGFAPINELSTYTVGLSDIPVKGTSDFDIRLFDASREVSALTMPYTRLRGAFADVVLWDDIFEVSASHGMPMSSFNFLSEKSISTRDSFVDAVKVSLFPNSNTHRYAFNYAKGYGSDREEYLTDEVYSLEGKQRLGEFDLNAELARDDASQASLAGISWATGLLKHALHVRDIDKKFTNIISSASNQGERGATWTTHGNWEDKSFDVYADVYQDRLYPNADNPDALNYDTNASISLPLKSEYVLDLTGRYVDTPGEASPRRYASGDVRLRRELPVWSGRKGSVYVGSSYQRSRFSFSPESEYNRHGVVIGLQAPLTSLLSAYLNYEYSWLYDIFSSQDYNPAVFNAGLNYSKQMSDKLSGNWSVTYRDEQDVEGRNSFLAGEDSVSVSAGLTYNPRPDVSLFCNAQARSVWSQVESSSSYNDLDVRAGLRMDWGLGFSWDAQGEVAGFVFKDLDGDKEFGLGDEGVSGVKVVVGETEVITDDRGWYEVSIRGKSATVSPVLKSLPAGFVFTTAAVQKAIISQGSTYRADFGLTSQSGIYGVAFVDQNGNGKPDKDDRFVGRVKLVLDGKHSRVTDAQGSYFFNDIQKGQHEISIDMTVLPSEFIPAVKLKNKVDVSEGTTYVFHIPLKVKPANP